MTKNVKETALSMTNGQIGDRYALNGRFGLLDLGKAAAFIKDQVAAEKPDLAAWERLLPLLDKQTDEKVRMRQGSRFDQLLTNESLWDEGHRFAEHLDHDQLEKSEIWNRLTLVARFFLKHLGDARIFELDKDRVFCFCHECHEAYVVVADHDDDAVHLEEFLHSIDHCFIALRSWHRGGVKSKAAHDWLCQQAQAALSLHCKDASAAYDAAVAVSPDCKRILAADQVVLYTVDEKGHMTFKVHEAKDFAARKVLLRVPERIVDEEKGLFRPSTESRVKKALNPSAMKKLVSQALKRKRPQVLRVIGKYRILFANASDWLPAYVR